MKVKEMMAILADLEAGESLRLPVILEYAEAKDIEEFNKKFIEVINKFNPPTLELYGWAEFATQDIKSFSFMYSNFFSTLFKLKIPHIHLTFNDLDHAKGTDIISTIYDAMNKAADELEDPCTTHVSCYIELKDDTSPQKSNLSTLFSKFIQWNTRRTTVSYLSLNNMLAFGQELLNQGDLLHTMRIYQDILLYDEKFVDAYVNLAYCYQLMADYKNAITFLSQAINLLPNETEEASRLAYCYAIKGRMALNLAKEIADFVLAREDLEKAIALDADRKDTPLWLQECEANLDKLTEVSMSALMSGSIFSSPRVDIKAIDHEEKKFGL